MNLKIKSSEPAASNFLFFSFLFFFLLNNYEANIKIERSTAAEEGKKNDCSECFLSLFMQPQGTELFPGKVFGI